MIPLLRNKPHFAYSKHENKKTHWNWLFKVIYLLSGVKSSSRLCYVFVIISKVLYVGMTWSSQALIRCLFTQNKLRKTSKTVRPCFLLQNKIKQNYKLFLEMIWSLYRPFSLGIHEKGQLWVASYIGFWVRVPTLKITLWMPISMWLFINML